MLEQILKNYSSDFTDATGHKIKYGDTLKFTNKYSHDDLTLDKDIRWISRGEKNELTTLDCFLRIDIVKNGEL